MAPTSELVGAIRLRFSVSAARRRPWRSALGATVAAHIARRGDEAADPDRLLGRAGAGRGAALGARRLGTAAVAAALLRRLRLGLCGATGAVAAGSRRADIRRPATLAARGALALRVGALRLALSPSNGSTAAALLLLHGSPGLRLHVRGDVADERRDGARRRGHALRRHRDRRLAEEGLQVLLLCGERDRHDVALAAGTGGTARAVQVRL